MPRPLVATIAALVTSASLLAGLALAQEEKKDGRADLPLKKVVMFSSGVGFFEHDGKVTGDGRVDLKFKVEDINDLLKSMVLQDLGGGKISTVTYDSRSPITKTLETFAINLTENPTRADLLRQIRGEGVELEAPTPITGKIIGVESREVPSGEDEKVQKDFLILSTEAGLRSIPLDSVTTIRLLDEKLNSELQQALEVLAMAHSTDQKTVTLNFLGAGERQVRVGYIQESPIWKTSYRLVLKEDEAPFLQGWAIVENTTEEDWKDIDLTLVSGRPISFLMDLYQPLFVQRPMVEPELYASLRPQTYGQDLSGRKLDLLKRKNQPVAAAPAPASGPVPQEEQQYDGVASDFAAGSAAPSDRFLRESGKANMNLGLSGQSMAQAGDVGELFRYAIATPVTLDRQKSAMLPIVNQSVEGEKLSIYNQSVQAKHPLNGLRLKNTTDLNLMQGPITVFDDGVYAGDARIEDLQPGTERLISYALDLDVEVAPESKAHPEQLTSVVINKGTLHAKRKYIRETAFTIKNSADEAKDLLIEYPYDSSWTLVHPEEPAEKTRNLYRFAVTAEPGKPETLTVKEENIVQQSYALTNLDDNMIVFYVNSKVISEEVKTALQEVLKRKQELQQLVARRQRLQEQIQAIDQEQNRIRQNMSQLDRNTDLYNRYVKKFGEQEDEVERLRGEIEDLTEQEAKLRKSLDQYLSELKVE